MGIVAAAVEAASSTKAGVAASAVGTVSTVWHVAGFPWSLVTAIGTAVLVLFHAIIALPRVVRVLTSIKQGVVNHTWALWRKLGDQPVPEDSD